METNNQVLYNKETYQKFARYYDAYVSGFHADIGLYLKYCRAGERILEIGCGTGRILEPLAATGAMITGVDISEAMLAAAEQKLARQMEAGVVTLRNHDFAKRPMEESFDRVFITFYTLNYLMDDSDRKAFLSNVYKCMNTGGILIADLFCPSALIRPEHERENHEKREGQWAEKSFIMDGRQIFLKDKRTMKGNMEERIQVYIDGERSDEIITLRRFFTKEDMLKMLSEAGYTSIKFIDGYDHGSLHALKKDERTKGNFIVMAMKFVK